MQNNKPAATAQEVAQWSDMELSKYAVSLYESGTVGYDLDYIIDNLSFVRTWLKANQRSDASLVARCELYNITI